MANHFWQVKAKLGDPVQTSDGFSGRISAIEKDRIIVLYDAPVEVLKKFGLRKREGYPFKGLTLSK